MRDVDIALTVVAFVAAVIAARFWYRSARVPVDPGWNMPGKGGAIEPTDEATKAIAWATALVKTSAKASALNRKAALWTAASALAAAAGALAGAWA